MIHDFGRYSAIAVKLLPAAVATAVLILAPAERFGRYSSMLPFAEIEVSFAETEEAVRAEPRQRSIREASSARESVPVRTAMP